MQHIRPRLYPVMYQLPVCQPVQVRKKIKFVLGHDFRSFRTHGISLETRVYEYNGMTGQLGVCYHIL